uniref:Uncharacterized protein n=1 Tax=Trichobilharzia regenti TaxID=157069 RepID=A0AA85K318_TRIRE|nr:unnamed protein product [Trichobilharzia regenti]
MKSSYGLIVLLCIIVLCTGEIMDEDGFNRPGYEMYAKLPHTSDEILTDILQGNSESNNKWLPVDSDDLGRNKLFYVHRRRFTRPNGR